VKTPTAGQLRTKVTFYQNVSTIGTGGDVGITQTLYRTAWGKLTATPMSEGFSGGVDTSQSYDLWVRMDRALPLVKPLTAYANGYWFNVNSIEVIMQHAYRWEKLRLTIDRYDEIQTTSTTSTTSTSTTSTTTTTTLGLLTSLYFITPTAEGGITTPHQALQHTIPALNIISFKTATALIAATDWGARRGQLYIEFANTVPNSYCRVNLYRYNAGGEYELGEWNLSNTPQGIPFSIDLDNLTWDAWTSRSAVDGLRVQLWNQGLLDQALKCDATDESSLEVEL